MTNFPRINVRDPPEQLGENLAAAEKVANSLEHYYPYLLPKDQVEILLIAAQMILTRKGSTHTISSLSDEHLLNIARDYSQLRWGDVEGLA